MTKLTLQLPFRNRVRNSQGAINLQLISAHMCVSFSYVQGSDHTQLKKDWTGFTMIRSRSDLGEAPRALTLDGAKGKVYAAVVSELDAVATLRDVPWSNVV